jgi:predicted secreted protein
MNIRPWHYLLLAFLMLAAAQVHAQTRVCPDECSYSSIQAAIDAAKPGDEIVIESGIYKEDLDINRSITLHGLEIGNGRPVLASCDSIAVNAEGFGLRGLEFADEHSLNITGSGYIYLNNFPASGGMLVDGGSTWNSTELITYQFESKIFRGRMGNYWADYAGKDENRDGIGDEPKVIDSRNIDYYPLMQPMESYGIADEREDRMETIKARTGEPFNITLDSNPTTGYRWYADYDYGLMKLDDQRYERDASSAIGGGGKETFTFTPLRSGETRISMVYRRPWENIAADVRSFQVLIS